VEFIGIGKGCRGYGRLDVRLVLRLRMRCYFFIFFLPSLCSSIHVSLAFIAWACYIVRTVKPYVILCFRFSLHVSVCIIA
jgi:hypothetical protein